jgi:hypothetical protein
MNDTSQPVIASIDHSSFIIYQFITYNSKLSPFFGIITCGNPSSASVALNDSMLLVFAVNQENTFKCFGRLHFNKINQVIAITVTAEHVNFFDIGQYLMVVTL